MPPRLSEIALFLDQLSDLLSIFIPLAILLVLSHHYYKHCHTHKSGTRINRQTQRPRIGMEQQQDIKLGGLSINFPYVPYGIQKAMLAKVGVTLTNKEHSLIESPTGTVGHISLLLHSAS